MREPKLITLDTETAGLGGKIKRIAIYDGNTIDYGYTFKDVQPTLERWYKDGYLPHIYIHNLDFDMRKILEALTDGNVNWKKTMLINNRLATLSCKHWIFHDSFKILPFSLKKISKDFDLEYQKMDLWYAVLQKYGPGAYKDIGDYFVRCDVDDDIYIKYLGYDVLSLYEALEKLMQICDLDLETFVKKVSTSAISRHIYKVGHRGKVFRQSEHKSDFEILTTCKGWSSDKKMRGEQISWQQLEGKIREAFYGGRTEVFKPHAGHAHYYDQNSKYPYEMQRQKFPVGWPEYYSVPEFAERKYKNWLRCHNGLGFVHADVYIPKQHIPPLPAKKGKLFFPCGYITGWWTNIELEYAMLHCDVQLLRVHEYIHFRQTYPVFRDFVDYLYPMKVQGKIEHKPVLATFAKLLLNVGYGWTGMKRERSSLKPIGEKEKWEEKGRQILSENEKFGFIEVSEFLKTPNIQVAVAAYVTSYARVDLLQTMLLLQKKGAIYYCDTDSIVSDAQLPADLIHPYDLGKWDEEHEISEGIFLQPKVYYIIDVDTGFSGRFKGVHRKPKKDEYMRIYHELIKGKEDRLIIERDIERLSSLIVSMRKDADPDAVQLLDKSINLKAKQKREVDYKCNHTSPYFFPSLEAFRQFTFQGKVRTVEDPPLFGRMT